jgi:hypothetical protein
MSQTHYNPTDNVDDNFTFEIRGKKYVMRYPITEEVEEVQNISAKLQKAQDDNNTDEIKKLSDSLEAYLYGFITPEGHETPIKEALRKENIRVMRNFNTMIKTELSIQ